MSDSDIRLISHRLNETEKHIEKQDGEIAALRNKISEMKIESEAREKKRLIWGVGTLGSVVLTLVGVIWQYRGVIFK